MTTDRRAGRANAPLVFAGYVMSRHVPRKARWTHLNAKEYRAEYGVVRFEAGAWIGTLIYEMAERGVSESEIVWRKEQFTTGRYKRPRNAMMAVEDKAREIRRHHGEKVRVAFKD